MFEYPLIGLAAAIVFLMAAVVIAETKPAETPISVLRMVAIVGLCGLAVLLLALVL